MKKCLPILLLGFLSNCMQISKDDVHNQNLEILLCDSLYFNDCFVYGARTSSGDTVVFVSRMIQDCQNEFIQNIDTLKVGNRYSLTLESIDSTYDLSSRHRILNLEQIFMNRLIWSSYELSRKESDHYKGKLFVAKNVCGVLINHK